MKNKKKQQFELILNEVKHDASDPTKTHASFIIMDTSTSLNNVEVSEEVLLEAASSILGMPIVTKFLKDEADFGDHEDFLDEDKNGNKFVNRGTIAIGSFTSEGYMDDIEINGESKRVFMADGVLWRSRYPDAIQLLVDLFNEGKSIPMSCEYLYANYSFIDGVEVHHSPIYFEGHCLLGQTVAPAYESATVLSLNQLKEFKQLVAQVLNQEKEVMDLEEKENTQVNENEEVETEQEEQKTQLNELSLYQISDEVRNQVKASIDNEEWLWVSDIYQSYAVIAVETDTDYKHYKYEYSVDGEVVTVNLESKTEVQEKREWQSVTNSLNEEITTLNTKIEELTSSKNDLADKFTQATETITTLNAQIEELKPIQEQLLNVQRETQLNEANEKYESAFNKINAKEVFDTEEVQTLVTQSIEDGEIGVNAKLALNDKILELVVTKQEDREMQTQLNSQLLAGISSKRKDLNVAGNDVLSDLRA